MSTYSSFNEALTPYRAIISSLSADLHIVEIHHPSEPLLLINMTLDRQDFEDPFRLNAVVESLRAQLNSLSAYFQCVILAGDNCHYQSA